MSLNTKQQEALQTLSQFIIDPTMNEIVLTGTAGTGKTYLINYFINHELPKVLKAISLVSNETVINKVQLTATTHKAAKVLQEDCSEKVSTIHSYMNLKLVNNYVTGKTKLTKTKCYDIKEYTLIIIDESSMIDSNLLELIRDTVNKCKIIFIGDKNQLTPVKESSCPVFSGDIPIIELTESMRFQGNIKTLCDKLNQGVETQTFHTIEAAPPEIVYLSKSEAQDTIVRYFDQNRYVPSRVKILTYSNKKSILYNNFIRQEIWGLPEELTLGEYAVCNNAVLSKSASGISSSSLLIPVDTTGLITNIGINFMFEEVEVHSVTLDHTHTMYVAKNIDELNYRLKVLAKQEDWTTYYKLKEQVADLRPVCSSTVHKSQGSTYNTVFVDLTDIGLCRNKNVVTRLLNVALSRAKEQIYLIGDLPNKYKG